MLLWSTTRSAADNNWEAACWSPELRLYACVAISDSGSGTRAMTSADGISWTLRQTPADNSWISICWSAELHLLVAVASSGTGNRVMTSTDGLS